MRRVFLTLVALVLCLGLASQASANIFNTPGTYDIKFNGYEYAYWGSHSEFMGGTADTIDSYYNLLNPDGTLKTEFSMSAVTYITTATRLDAKGNPIYPSAYSESENRAAGAYVAILHGLQAGMSVGNMVADRAATMYFTGGVLDWYFIPSGLVSDFSDMAYEAGVGLTGAMGKLADMLDKLTPFAQLELAKTVEYNGKWYTGSADLTLAGDTYLVGHPRFYADVIEDGSIFDSNLFDGHDLTFQATLYWNELMHRFTINDPASVNVPTPEPGTLSLMALGLLLTAFYVSRRKNMG